MFSQLIIQVHGMIKTKEQPKKKNIDYESSYYTDNENLNVVAYDRKSTVRRN